MGGVPTPKNAKSTHPYKRFLQQWRAHCLCHKTILLAIPISCPNIFFYDLIISPLMKTYNDKHVQNVVIFHTKNYLLSSKLKSIPWSENKEEKNIYFHVNMQCGKLSLFNNGFIKNTKDKIFFCFRFIFFLTMSIINYSYMRLYLSNPCYKIFATSHSYIYNIVSPTRNQI